MFIGIEIGGTKLQLGVGAGDGRLVALWRGTVDVNAGAAGIRQQIVTAVPELLARASLRPDAIRGIGIGFGGPVDDAGARVIKSHQIAGWDDFPLAQWIADMLVWPAVLGNDADLAGLAEALFGAGKGLSPVFYITIGSGIGGGLITDGRIFRGCGRGAAEIGHLKILLSRPLPSGRTLGVLEEFASGWAIQQQARDRLKGCDRSLILELADHDIDRVSAAHVANAAAQGDALALSILGTAWDSLALAISHVLALLCPRRIIIGGGVSLMGEELLFKPLRERVASLAFEPFAACYDIVPAVLGEEVVVHGALALARIKGDGHVYFSGS